METEVAIRTWSEANTRRHWAARARIAKSQREAAYYSLLGSTEFRRMDKEGFLDIHLIRIAPRKLDSDNLAGSLKACRDGIADALGRDDGDDALRWHYDQRRGSPKEYSVRVQIYASTSKLPAEGGQGSIWSPAGRR